MMVEETGLAFILGRSEAKELTGELEAIFAELPGFRFPMLSQMSNVLSNKGYTAGAVPTIPLTERETT